MTKQDRGINRASSKAKLRKRRPLFYRPAIILQIAIACLMTGETLCLAQGPYPFQDPKVDTEARITDLLSRMTLEEKIDALSTNPTVPRLGVVGTGHVEGLHGLALGGPGGWEGKNQTVIPTTTFPQARGLGQTWDPALIQKLAAEEAFETDYAFGKYHRGGRVVRAPNADLSRDPRWGRSEESYGEDPFLVGTMATAFTRGLQGDDPRYWVTSSLLKHFLANSNEDGRGSSSSNFDERLFREYYSVPFRMAIQQGHADAMMTAYNAWNGTPMEVNPVLRNVVMKEWGFDGILCTDGGALTNLVKEHHAFPDLPHAAAASIHAGINQFLDDFKAPVRQAIAEGLITEDDISKNLRGVFRVMIHLGLWDAGAPYNGIGEETHPDQDPWWSEANRALARKATDESIVLLKNDGSTLPLHSPKSIAVIGPLADRVALDWYSGTPPFAITPLTGIRARAHGANVTYSDGSDLAAAAELAKKADVAIVIIGNHPTCDAGWAKCPLPSDGKEAIDRKSLTLEQEAIAKAVFAANPHTVVVLQASFPYTTTWTQQLVPAIVEMTHNSEEQGDGLADVLFGDYNPAGRLTQTWVANMSDLPPMMDYNLRDGRTYLWAKVKPLYPFGYGLSYSHFDYSHLKLSTHELQQGQTVEVSAEITNTSDRDGDEVVQLYASHRNSAVERPLEELKNFQRVFVPAHKTLQVILQLHADDLRYWDASQAAFMLESDTVEVRVGAASNDIRLSEDLEVKGR
jgi:beta-glucosidase